jgi:hypothetical protein
VSHIGGLSPKTRRLPAGCTDRLCQYRNGRSPRSSFPHALWSLSTSLIVHVSNFCCLGELMLHAQCSIHRRGTVLSDPHVDEVLFHASFVRRGTVRHRRGNVLQALKSLTTHECQAVFCLLCIHCVYCVQLHCPLYQSFESATESDLSWDLF